jgi:hypothetical protein
VAIQDDVPWTSSVPGNVETDPDRTLLV